VGGEILLMRCQTMAKVKLSYRRRHGMRRQTEVSCGAEGDTVKEAKGSKVLGEWRVGVSWANSVT
jgi:hypothetical protein